jgi:hypothetical protein
MEVNMKSILEKIVKEALNIERDSNGDIAACEIVFTRLRDKFGEKHEISFNSIGIDDNENYEIGELVLEAKNGLVFFTFTVETTICIFWMEPDYYINLNKGI